MKARAVRAVVAAALAGLLVGCAPLDRTDLFASSRDARAYNPQTGRFEWPDAAPPAAPRKPRVNLRDEPARRDERRGIFNPDDERIYNPQTGRYEWSTEGHTPGATGSKFQSE